MPSKKRTYLQQFGIIHLPNPDLTYIRNPERETKLYLYPSTSWKLKSGTLLCYFFFHPPTWLETTMPTARPLAYIYALEAGFSQVAKNCQVFCQTIGGVFLMFLPKIRDGNSIWTAGCSKRCRVNFLSSDGVNHASTRGGQYHADNVMLMSQHFLCFIFF